MVWLCAVFFFHRNNIYKQYKEYFGVGDEDNKVDEDGDEDNPKLSKKEATARFYFAASVELANNDITKMKQIDSMPLYLCLNMLSRNKDIREIERREIEKLKNKKWNNI